MPGGFIWRWNERWCTEVDSVLCTSSDGQLSTMNYTSNQSQNIADAKKVYSHDACCPILLPERFLSEENMCSAVLSKLLRLQLFAAAATKISEGQKTTERNFFDLTKAGPAFKTFILCYSIPVLELITLFFFKAGLFSRPERCITLQHSETVIWCCLADGQEAVEAAQVNRIGRMTVRCRFKSKVLLLHRPPGMQLTVDRNCSSSGMHVSSIQQ